MQLKVAWPESHLKTKAVKDTDPSNLINQWHSSAKVERYAYVSKDSTIVWGKSIEAYQAVEGFSVIRSSGVKCADEYKSIGWKGNLRWGNSGHECDFPIVNIWLDFMENSTSYIVCLGIRKSSLV